jgi:23S rRNA pseudouridine2605 synthase
MPSLADNTVMRINKFIAGSTGLSRRAADKIVEEGRVRINGAPATLSSQVGPADTVSLDGKPLGTAAETQTILINKPAGYVVSREGQGSKTIYDLLPPKMHHLKPIGRLDKASSGLLLLTTDGQLAHQLTHPSFQKVKIYEVQLDQSLQPLHRQMISEIGIQLEDGPSRFSLERLEEGDELRWRVTMHEGRNRQIRRTFAALGYTVVILHRTQFGNYLLPEKLKSGSFTEINS